MEYMMEEVKDTISSLGSFLDSLIENSNLKELLGGNNCKLSEILRFDMLHFLAYLAVSDKIISWDEARFIGKLLDLNMTPNKIKEIIIDNNLYSEEFEENPSLSLQIIVAMDNSIYESSMNLGIELGKSLLKIYLVIGQCLATSNGSEMEDMNPELERNFQTYMNMMLAYIEENTRKDHTDVFFDPEKVKQSTGVKAPNKNMDANPNELCKDGNSVKAPKKKS